MHHHNINCCPASETKQAQRQALIDKLALAACVVVFATIGVLLAYRG